MSRSTWNSRKAGDEGPLKESKKPQPVKRDKRASDVREIVQLGALIRSVKIETSTQTKENIPFKMVTKPMIAPGARDAPKFSSRWPQELRRFVRQMEDLWQDAGITEADEKKKSIGKYADQESEEEWEGLTTYEKGYSWEEFKNELIENYPEAAAAERGTPARLRQLCSETKGICLGDLVTLYAFRRAFLAEAKKLSRPPAAMSNRELVELFIGSMSETMASATLQFLGNKGENGSKQECEQVEKGKTKESSDKAQRRPEDRYDLDEVCKAAIRVSESSQGMFHLMNKEIPGPVSERRVLMHGLPSSESNTWQEKIEELESIQAQERDKLDVVHKNMDSRFSGIEGMIKILLAQVPGGNPGPNGQYNSNNGMKLGAPGTVPKAGGQLRYGEGSKCFYCGQKGHFIPECEEVKEDVRNSLVKLDIDGKLKLADGSYIPNMPNVTTIKEQVEKYYARKQSQYWIASEEEDNA